MKNKLFLSLFLFCTSFANAIEIDYSGLMVRAADDHYCKLSLPESLKIVSRSSFPNETQFISNKIYNWVQAFKNANDPLIKQHNHVLCVGFYNDSISPNAIAYSNQAILFGPRLLSILPNLSSANYWDSLNFILAHEFSHYLQNLNQLKFEYQLPLLSTKIKELHADCMAGYILQSHSEMDFYSNDNKIADLIAKLGDSHSIGDHGTAQDRIRAVAYGIGAAELEAKMGFYADTTKVNKIIHTCALLSRPTNLKAESAE